MMNSRFSFSTVHIPMVKAIKLRQEIEHFNVEYCAVLDAGDIEVWPSFFVENGIYRVASRENAERGLLVGLVYAEGRAMLRDRAVAINRTQMFAPRRLLHLVNNVRPLHESTNGEITAQANFLLLQTLVEGPTTVHLAGNYYDRFARVDGSLKLVERQVIYDTEVLANDLIHPV